MDAPLRILILEDVPTDFELIRYELRKARLEFEAIRVDTRAGFIEALQRFRPDLIISDYTLPSFDGLEALRLTRAMAPGVPFIIATGSINEETAVGVMKAGAADYVIKNNLVRIGPAARGALERSRVERAKEEAEAALRKSEANLQAIFNNSLQGFILADRDGSVLAFNRTASRWATIVAGRELDEGLGLFGLLAPDDGAFLRNRFGCALAGESITFEREVRCRDGAGRWFEFSCVPVRGGDGAPTGVAVSILDIDERKRAAEALRQSELRFRSLVQNSSDIITVLDLDGTIRYASASTERILGYPPTALVGTNVLGYLHPDDAAVLLPAVTRPPETLPEEGRLEFRFRHADGRWIDLEAVGSNRVADPIIRGIIVNARDVTERKQAERQLRESEERYRDLFENASDLIQQVAPDGRILYVNPAWRAALGYDDEEIARLSVLDVVHPASRAHAETVLRRALAGEALEQVELMLVTKGGRTITVEGNLSGTFKEGRPVATRGIFRDITERKRAEQELRAFAAKLERSNRELEDFASVAAHDLQEPLRKIQAFGDRLRASAPQLDAQAQDYLRRMQEAARRMQALITDLLSFARVTTRGDRLARVELDDVVREALADLEFLVEQCGGRVELGPLPAIEADPVQMRQLFQNLISNALKFHRPGEPPVVRIDSERLPPAEGSEVERCRIRVRDNGIGFDPKYVGRIFNIFQRLHGRGDYRGTGVGLAICRKIAQAHGGDITASSAPGEGATFVVTLPVRQER
ncbi:MAG TPA: PAS domain S-box protein [Gemmatimonadales bacterium]|nr:PAS domain S-box protein [Gemmatimonadales bacterium]